MQITTPNLKIRFGKAFEATVTSVFAIFVMFLLVFDYLGGSALGSVAIANILPLNQIPEFAERMKFDQGHDLQYVLRSLRDPSG